MYFPYLNEEYNLSWFNGYKNKIPEDLQIFLEENSSMRGLVFKKKIFDRQLSEVITSFYIRKESHYALMINIEILISNHWKETGGKKATLDADEWKIVSNLYFLAARFTMDPLNPSVLDFKQRMSPHPDLLEAKEYISRAIDINNSSSRFYILSAEINIECENFEDALKDIDKVNQLDGEFDDSYLRRKCT